MKERQEERLSVSLVLSLRQRKEHQLRQRKDRLFMSKEDEVFRRDVGDANSDTGVAEEGDDNAMATDTLDFTLNIGEGTRHDLDFPTLFVNELIVGEWNTLVLRILTGSRITEVLHLLVGYPDNLCLLSLEAMALRHEFHQVAVFSVTLQQLQLDLHGIYEHHVVNRPQQSALKGIAKIVLWYFLKMEIGLISLVEEGLVDSDGTFLAGIPNIHRIPVELVIVFFLHQLGIVFPIVSEVETILLAEEVRIE